MATSVFGGEAAPHPSDRDVFTISATGATAGNETFTVKSVGKVDTDVVIAWNSTSAAAKTAIDAAALCTVTGGPLNTTPLVVTFDKSVSPVEMVKKSGAFTTTPSTLTRTQTASNSGGNITSRDATQPATSSAHPRYDPQYGQTPYNPDPAAVSAAVIAKDAANALTDGTAQIRGGTARGAGERRVGFKNP